MIQSLAKRANKAFSFLRAARTLFSASVLVRCLVTLEPPAVVTHGNRISSLLFLTWNKDLRFINNNYCKTPLYSFAFYINGGKKE